MPNWDLSDLWFYLHSVVFEDLRGIPFSLLTQKVLALLLIATGRRISEITHLSRITHVKGNRTYIEWIPGFRAKWDSGFSGFVPQSPSILKMKATRSRDLRNCPVNALQIFMERRDTVTGGHGEDRLWTIGAAGLASSFRSLVRASRRRMSMSVDIPMYPHQCKKLAVSYCWEYFDNVASKLPARVGNSSILFWKARIRGLCPLSVFVFHTLGHDLSIITIVSYSHVVHGLLLKNKPF